MAHLKLGEHHWKRACPQPAEDGACVKLERASGTGRQRAFDDLNRRSRAGGKKLKDRSSRQCGPSSSAKVTAIERAAGPARKGQKHFAAVLRLYDGGAALLRLPGGPEQKARAGLVTAAAAAATFYQGERVYEAFLRVQFPQGLDLRPPSSGQPPRRAAAVQKKYAAETKLLRKYLDDKSRLADSLAGPSLQKKGTFDRVLDFKVAEWTIAASARIGQVWANFAGQLHTAPLPRWIEETADGSGQSPRDIYCDQLDDTAAPLEEKALQGYGLCLRAAQEQSRFDGWSSLCEAELASSGPTSSRWRHEIRPQPGYAPAMVFPAGVITELAPRAPSPSRPHAGDRVDHERMRASSPSQESEIDVGSHGRSCRSAGRASRRARRAKQARRSASSMPLDVGARGDTGGGDEQAGTQVGRQADQPVGLGEAGLQRTGQAADVPLDDQSGGGCRRASGGPPSDRRRARHRRGARAAPVRGPRGAGSSAA